ncbi:hypothetical protein EBO15_28315 [Actinomadura harenae]|uniref:Uncharacterized protein n=1 Tax=Actinomadura harenae TaxID=2483351 RepID=A0A3M2LQV9_9ACTN|nr:hypothetical protein EBO15_28315 [Actinomadura harenae]
MTMRELCAYVRSLPQDGALGRAVMGEAAVYSPEVHRLTDIADLLQQHNYIAVRAAGGKARKPKPIRRPRPPVEGDA